MRAVERDKRIRAAKVKRTIRERIAAKTAAEQYKAQAERLARQQHFDPWPHPPKPAA